MHTYKYVYTVGAEIKVAIAKNYNFLTMRSNSHRVDRNV